LGLNRDKPPIRNVWCECGDGSVVKVMGAGRRNVVFANMSLLRYKHKVTGPMGIPFYQGYIVGKTIGWTDRAAKWMYIAATFMAHGATYEQAIRRTQRMEPQLKANDKYLPQDPRLAAIKARKSEHVFEKLDKRLDSFLESLENIAKNPGVGAKEKIKAAEIYLRFTKDIVSSADAVPYSPVNIGQAMIGTRIDEERLVTRRHQEHYEEVDIKAEEAEDPYVETVENTTTESGE